MNRRVTLFAVAAALALAADQASKALARAWLSPERVVAFIPGFWDWNLSFNTGVAFSVGYGKSWAPALFSVIGVIACAAILVLVARGKDPRAVHAVALGLIFAGALGNLVDRLIFGHVTDFILWRAGSHRWPRFNVADAALLVGVALLFLADLRRPRPAARDRTAG